MPIPAFRARNFAKKATVAAEVAFELLVLAKISLGAMRVPK